MALKIKNQEEMRADASSRWDAGETVLIERGLAFIIAEAYDQETPPLKGLMYVPLSETDPDWAETVIYRQYTRVGLARFVNDRGTDVPMAEVFVKEFSKKYYTMGIGYIYTLQELLASSAAAARGFGRSVDAEKAISARDAIERGLDVAAAIGSASSATIPGLSITLGTDVGVLGILNQPNATIYTVPVGAFGTQAWATKSPDEIVADIAGLLAAIKISSYDTFMANTVLMPIEDLLLIVQRRMGDGSDKSILNYCLETLGRIYPGLTIDSWQYCKGAGVGGTDRMVAFNSNPRFAAHRVSRRFRQDPPQYQNWEVKVLCSARSAGVMAPYPMTIAYADGI